MYEQKRLSLNSQDIIYTLGCHIIKKTNQHLCSNQFKTRVLLPTL